MMRILLLVLALLIGIPSAARAQMVVAANAWGPCVNGQQTKTETVTTTTIAANGSATSTTTTRPASRACTTTTPVNCVVSAFTLTSATAWGSCVNGTQTRSETWTRTVITPASNGGTSCPALSEIRTGSQSCTVTPPPPPPTGADIVLRDNFNYTVGRTDPNASNLFVQAGVGWTHVKTQQNAPGAHGYLHTDPLPGVPPSPGGGRYLSMEALPTQLGGQTDFYLGMGNGTSSTFANTLPGDVWIQFWIYPLRDAAHPSEFGTRDKFLYACNGDYGCHSHLWMVMADSYTYEPDHPGDGFPSGNPSPGSIYWVTRQADGVSDMVNTTGDPDARGNIGPQTVNDWVRPNRWTLVKMHFNTTSTFGNSWEVWLKPQGGQWVKTTDWKGGVTPGFTWNIPAASVGGHRVMRMPSTVDHNFWIGMDDFTIARTEAALPIYQ